jgi:nitrous oxide reductase accessory protein NosL
VLRGLRSGAAGLALAALAGGLAGSPRARAAPAATAEAPPPAPGRADKCPVCGMFVARYPDWVASARLRDGRTFFFDGAKDLFTFLLDPGEHVPGVAAADVAASFVTDYYAVRPVDARAAFYVRGSDVLGPMGHELVPFATEADARAFLADHRGAGVLRAGEVSAAVLGALR